MSKYSPKWFANQRRLAEMGVQTTPYNDTFAGTYGTAGGGLAGVKAGQMQYGPSAYTVEEASQLARTGTIPKPAPGVASIFSSSTPVQQAAQTSSNQVTSAQQEGPVSSNEAAPTSKVNFQDVVKELTALNTGSTNTPSTTGGSTTSSPTESTRQELIDEAFNKQYGGGMSAAELQDFETLIGRLEGSKMRQAGQLNRARQRERYSGGLASMMRNF